MLLNILGRVIMLITFKNMYYQATIFIKAKSDEDISSWSEEAIWNHLKVKYTIAQLQLFLYLLI